MIRRIYTSVTPSDKLLRACALFGLGVTAKPVERLRAWPSGPRIVRITGQRPGGSLTIISGPSGCGKTTLLRRLRRGLIRAGQSPIAPPRSIPARRAVIDLFDAPLDETLRLLACAGLADASILPRTARDLSEGERVRLRLALALARRPRHLLIDEFGASLDSATTRTLVLLLRRFAGTTGTRIVLATTRGAECGVGHTRFLSP